MVVKVLVSANEVDDALDWAKKHCSGYITNTGLIMDTDDLFYPTALYCFYFENETPDVTTFILKWT